MGEVGRQNVHQVAKMTGEKQDKYREWVWRMRWQEMKILKPDLVIVLFVDPEVCRQNILNKQKRKYTDGKNMDQAEEDFNHQMRAAEEYRRMINENPGWWVGVECCQNGKMLPPEEIFKMVWEKVERKN